MQLMTSRPWLRQIKHQVSCGQSAAVSTGVRHARANVVVTLDGDGQNNPAFIPALFNALAAGGPARGAGCRAARRPTGDRLQKVSIAAGEWRARRGAARRHPRYRMRPQGVPPRAVSCAAYFDGLHRFLPALARREGYEVAYVDVVDRPRHSGTSNYGMWDRLWIGILDLLGVWWLIRRRRRVPQVLEVKRNAD
jgi:glycosyltransferase involved in cell wall biosynthesis